MIANCTHLKIIPVSVTDSPVFCGEFKASRLEILMNSKNTYPVPSAYFVGITASAAVALIASVLYGIAYHTSYDTTIRHFEFGAVLPTVFGVLMALSAVIFTVSSLLLRKKYTIADNAPKNAETFALWFCGLMFLIFGVMSLSSGSGTASSEIGVVCNKALAPLAIISAVPFFLRTSESMRNSAVHSVLTFAPVLWGICLLFKYYFDLKEMPLNDPELTLTMVSISCAVIFFLCECRNSLGISSSAISVFCPSAALCLTGSISGARLVLWRTDGHVLPAPTETLLLFAVAVLAGCRLLEIAGSFAPAEEKTEDREAAEESAPEEASENEENA